MKIRTAVNVSVRRFSFSIGWYSGEDWCLLDLDVLKYMTDIAFTILNIQILKFALYIGIEIPDKP